MRCLLNRPQVVRVISRQTFCPNPEFSGGSTENVSEDSGRRHRLVDGQRVQRDGRSPGRRRGRREERPGGGLG